DRVEEGLVFALAAVALVARAACRTPEADFRAGLAELLGPLLADPVPGAPHAIETEAYALAGERPGIGAGAGIVVIPVRCGVQHETCRHLRSSPVESQHAAISMAAVTLYENPAPSLAAGQGEFSRSAR